MDFEELMKRYDPDSKRKKEEAVRMLEKDLSRGCIARVARKLGLSYRYVSQLKKIAEARVKAKRMYGGKNENNDR